jgi:hypothetical protein
LFNEKKRKLPKRVVVMKGWRVLAKFPFEFIFYKFKKEKVLLFQIFWAPCEVVSTSITSGFGCENWEEKIS